MRLGKNFYRAIFLLIALFGSSSAKTSKFDDPVKSETLLNEGRADEAIAALQSRLANDKRDASALHLLSRAYYSVGLWDQSIKAGERAVALAPERSEYHLWLGRAYGNKAENSNPFSAFNLARKARSQFEKAVELDGNNIDARSDLTEYYTQAQIAAIAKKDASTAHYLSARLAEKDKNFSEAEQEYKAAIRESKTPADQWVNLASFYRQRDNLAAMEEAIEKMATAARKDAGVLVDGASVLLQAGRNLPKAVQMLQEYLSLPDKVEDAPAFRAEYLLGQVLEKQGDRAGAAKEYEKALRLARDYVDARAALRRLKP